MSDVDYSIKLLIDAQNNASKELEKVGGQVDSIGSTLGNLGKVASGLGITKVFKNLSSSVLEYAGNLEQANVAFSTILGSEEKATDMLKDLSEFAKKTPFDLVGVRENALQLQAMGIQADDVLPTLKALGDVSAGVGVELSRVALNYGQVATQGKLTGMELRDFTRMGIPLIKELAKYFGVAEEEIQKMVSAGKVGFEDVKNVFEEMTGEGGIFENLMEKQSQTFQGMLSNVQDSFGQIKETIGMAILPMLENLLNALMPIIEKVSNRIAEHQELAGRIAAVVGVVGLLTGALIALGGALPLISTGLAALSGPVGIVIGAITALGLARATNFGGIRDKTQEVIDFIQPYIQEFVETIQAFWQEHGEQIKVYLQAFWDWIKFLIDTAMEGVKLAFEGLFTALGVLLDIFQGDWEGAWEKIKNFGLQIANTIDKIMTKAFGDMRTNIKNGILEAYDRVVEKIGKLVDRIEKAVQRLKDAWNSAKERVSGVGDKVSGWFSRGSAVGGPLYAGQTYLVGENGPELFTPSQNGKITRNEDLGGLGGNITIQVSNSFEVSEGTDQESLAQTIADTITRQLELYKKGIY